MRTKIVILLAALAMGCSTLTGPLDDHVGHDTVTPLDHDSIVKFTRPILSINADIEEE